MLLNSGEDIERQSEMTVVLIDFGEDASCVGVAVGPHAILTAAHCAAFIPEHMVVTLTYADTTEDFDIKKVFVAGDVTDSDEQHS